MLYLASCIAIDKLFRTNLTPAMLFFSGRFHLKAAGATLYRPSGPHSVATVGCRGFPNAGRFEQRIFLWEKPMDPIKHVIWLMLENRSFDHMLGSMQQLYPDVDGV